MKILLIGFRYQEIEEMQDRLLSELPQIKIDFAISIRDSWYRFNLSCYDLILLDTTSSDTDSMVTFQEVTLRSEGIPVVLLVAKEEMDKLFQTNEPRPGYVLLKNETYINKLVAMLKEKQETTSELHFQPHEATVSTGADIHTPFDRNLLELMLGGLSDGLLFCNADHQILLLNPAAESILGIPKAKIIGHSIHTLPLGEGAKWLSEILKSIKLNMRFNSLATNTRINNHFVQIRFAPIFGREKYYLGGFLYLTEVEEPAIIAEENKFFVLNDKIFETLHFTAPTIIAEG